MIINDGSSNGNGPFDVNGVYELGNAWSYFGDTLNAQFAALNSAVTSVHWTGQGGSAFLNAWEQIHSQVLSQLPDMCYGIGEGINNYGTQAEQAEQKIAAEETAANLAVAFGALLGFISMVGMEILGPLQFSCLDYGGGSLHAFAGAPHVSGVAVRGEEERSRRILADALRLISQREELFRERGISSVGEFRRLRDAGELPADVNPADVCVIIDNWGGLRAGLPDVDALALGIAARGPGAGVHLLLTANRWGDVRMNLRDAIGARLELRLNDPAESEVNRRAARLIPSAGPGAASLRQACSTRSCCRGWTGGTAPTVSAKPRKKLWARSLRLGRARPRLRSGCCLSCCASAIYRQPTRPRPGPVRSWLSASVTWLPSVSTSPVPTSTASSSVTVARANPPSSAPGCGASRRCTSRRRSGS
jgi:uncharacterized protein YukE